MPRLQKENLRDMEITRRQFNRLIVAAAILCVAGARWCAAHAAPVVAPGAMAGKRARVLKALRPTAFPGRLRPLDNTEVRKAGKWSG